MKAFLGFCLFFLFTFTTVHAQKTWEWTQRMTLPKTALCFALGWLALVILATQEYNPFIYFIF